jgi:hypothetical protein
MITYNNVGQLKLKTENKSSAKIWSLELRNVTPCSRVSKWVRLWDHILEEIKCSQVRGTSRRRTAVV